MSMKEQRIRPQNNAEKRKAEKSRKFKAKREEQQEKYYDLSFFLNVSLCIMLQGLWVFFKKWGMVQWTPATRSLGANLSKAPAPVKPPQAAAVSSSGSLLFTLKLHNSSIELRNLAVKRWERIEEVLQWKSAWTPTTYESTLSKRANPSGTLLARFQCPRGRWYRRIARSAKLYRARSRLYRSQILQVDMRLKALAEI